MGSPYTIKDGDTLWAIARKFNVPLAALREKNPGLIPERLKVGTDIDLPGMEPDYAPMPFQFPDAPYQSSWAPQPQLMPKANPGQDAAPDGVAPDLAPQAPSAQQIGLEASANTPAQADNPFYKGQPLEEASAISREKFVNMGNEYLDSIKGHLSYPGELISGKRPFDLNEAIPWAVDMGVILATGGAAGGARVPRGAPRPAAPEAPLPSPVPAPPAPAAPMNLTPGMEWPRPFDYSRAHRNAQGNYGGPPLLEGEALARRRAHYERTADTRVADKASTAAGEDLHMKGLIESEHHKLLGTKPPRDYRRDFYLGAGTSEGKGNVIPFDPSAKHLTDPKTNLQRRMAKRTGQGEVVPQSRWDQAQVAKYEKEAKSERKPMSFAKGVPEKSMSRVKEDVAKMTPEQWMSLKSETQQSLLKQGIKPKYLRKGSRAELEDLITRMKKFQEDNPDTEF